MSRDGKQLGPDGRDVGDVLFRHTHHPVLLVLDHGAGILHAHDLRALRLGIGGHGLAAQVQCEGVAAGAAHHAGEQGSSRGKLQVRVGLAIASVLDHAGAGAQKLSGHLGVHREGRGAAHDQDLAADAVRLQAGLDLLDLLVHRGGSHLALLHAALVAVAVVAVHAAHDDAGQGVPLPVHRFHFIQRHTGAVLAHVHIHQHIGLAGLAQLADLLRVIADGKELHLREGGLQRGKALDVGAHQRVRQSQVLRTGLGGHFGLGDGGALEAVDARLDLHLDHLGHLVGLDVGPQAGSAACNVDHLADILTDDRRVINQLRAYDVLLTLKGIEVVVDLIHTPPASRSRPRCCPGRNWCPWRCGRADPSPRRTARTAGWSRR